MPKATLYTTNCPKCKILEAKLKSKNVEFDEIRDVKIMEEKGITSVPVLEIDGKMLGYLEAVKHVNSLN